MPVATEPVLWLWGTRPPRTGPAGRQTNDDDDLLAIKNLSLDCDASIYIWLNKYFAYH